MIFTSSLLLKTNPCASEDDSELVQAADIKGFRVFNLDFYSYYIRKLVVCIITARSHKAVSQESLKLVPERAFFSKEGGRDNIPLVKTIPYFFSLFFHQKLIF